MVSSNLVAAVLTLLPAMGLLWLYLRRYEGYFEQNRLFFALVVGLFAGTAVRFVEVALFPFDNPRLLQPEGDFSTGTLVYSFAYTMLGLAVLETFAKTAILGAKKFRARKDTPYYGAAVGLGFGAMWTIQVIASPTHGLVFDAASGKMVTTTPALVLDLFVFLLGMGLLLAQAASAIWVGRGSGEGRLWRGAMQGTFWLAPGLGMFWVFLNGGDQVYPAIGAVAWGIFAMAFADRRVLERIVPQDVRDMVRRERRRETRKMNRD
ncbi:MAG: hypothetical protein ABR562_01245 [Thermoplasmatota archaeon]